jgi:hypothetical protein
MMGQKRMPTENENRVYLGDGVYALVDGEGVLLTASNDIETTNAIYLNKYVLASFIGFITKIKQVQSDLEH